MKELFQSLSGVLIFVLIWIVLAGVVGKSIIIPPPVITFSLIIKYVTYPEVLIAICQSIWKVALALLFTILIGIPIGFMLGLCVTLYRLMRPIIMVIQAVPVISWLSLVIFFWGVGWKGPIFIATISLLPISILTTVSGVQNLDVQLLEMANFYRVPLRRVIKDIYLASLLPFIVAILDVCVGQAWKVILVTEYLCGGSGLGEKILMSRMNTDSASVWALTLIAVILGIMTELQIRLVLKKSIENGYLSRSIKPF